MIQNDDKGRGSDLTEWVSAVRRHLAAGETVEFSPKGESMLPTLRPATDTVYVRACADYAPMDIVLAVADKPPGVVLHRLMAVRGDRYILMGDANLYRTEECPRAGILGKVVGIRRRGRDVTAAPVTRLLRSLHRLGNGAPRLRRLLVRLFMICAGGRKPPFHNKCRR